MTRSAKGDEKRDEVVESALYKLSFSLSKYSKSNAEALFPKDESQHIDLTLTVNFPYSFILTFNIYFYVFFKKAMSWL